MLQKRADVAALCRRTTGASMRTRSRASGGRQQQQHTHGGTAAAALWLCARSRSGAVVRRGVTVTVVYD